MTPLSQIKRIYYVIHCHYCALHMPNGGTKVKIPLILKMVYEILGVGPIEQNHMDLVSPTRSFEQNLRRNYVFNVIG